MNRRTEANAVQGGGCRGSRGRVGYDHVRWLANAAAAGTQLMRATVLGAGAMGSAFASVLARAGDDVRLWGTHLDTVIVGQLRDGQPHPRTRVAVPSTVEIMDVRHLREEHTLRSLIVLAVSSEGALPTVTLALPVLTDEPLAMLILTKGLAISPEGRVELFNDAIRRALSAHVVDMPIVGLGGPCKANEVANGRPTFSVLAADRPGVAGTVAALVSTGSYQALASDDIVGIEVSAAEEPVCGRPWRV